MRSLDMRVTGTVRSNRTGKCPLKEDKQCKKKRVVTWSTDLMMKRFCKVE